MAYLVDEPKHTSKHEDAQHIEVLSKLDSVDLEKEEIAPKVDNLDANHMQKGTDEQQAKLYAQFAGQDATAHRKSTRSLLRKVDVHLLPFLMLMYLLNFLDRSNLAQARLGTLEEDLGMKGTDFNLATSILFIGYLLMQLPSNLIITRVKPGVYLGCVMAVWGCVSAAQGAVQSFGGLIATRFFLGFVEAPFFCGAIMLMSSYYTRKELAHRIAWFYSANSLANAFGGLIGAGVLANLSGKQGIAGWRWLFIIEGSITVAVALTAAIFLPNYPATTRWLSEEEKAYAQWRLIDDTGEADDAQSTSLWHGLKLALKDPRLYLFTLLQHISITVQTFQYFFPTIVGTLGYGSVHTLLLTAPVWIATFLMSLVVTYTSGRTGDRSIHIMCLMMITVLGCIIAVSTTSTGSRFFAMFLMPLGAVAAYQIIVAWIANSFIRPLVKRSASIAFANMIANLGSVYGSYMWPKSAGPQYVPGGAATAALSIVVALLAYILRRWLQNDNKKLAAMEVIESDGTVRNLHAGNPEAKAVGFRYIT